MIKISLSGQNRKQGPLTKESVVLLQIIKDFGETNTTTLRKKTHLVLSRFWKNITDLIDLNILQIKRTG